MGLSQRQQRILKTIISDYINRAEPVGSRTMTKRYEFDLSPATIRKEMADLEDMGYLEQPHTSAGRIPTEKGYRFFVDELISKGLMAKNPGLIKKKLTRVKALEIDEIIQMTAKSLAEMTEYTSLVMGPQTGRSAFQQIQAFPMDEKRMLMVLTTDTGIVESRPINIAGNLSYEELNNIIEHLNSRLQGLTIDDITPSLLSELRIDLMREVEIVEHALHILSESFKQGSSNIALGGTKNILNQPEFNNLEKVKELLTFFENEDLLAELLSNEEGIVVRIGTENPLEEVKDCSLVTASYELNGRPLGTIGVLGPTRMDYTKVIAIVAQIANELTVTLDDKKISEE